MNENRSGNRRKKLQERGYYIVLLLCVLAIGVSGYVFVSTAIRQNARQEESLSVPLTAEAVPSADRNKTAAAAVQGEDLEESNTQKPAKPDKAARRKAAREKAVPPVQGETVKTFSTTELSYNETTKDWRLHNAVDIAAEGQTVGACMAGQVTEIYDDDLLGTTVVISHDGGYETRYSNLTDVPAVKVGDTVQPGDTIGVVGETAILEASQEPHLHFQLLVDGVPVDPAEVLG